MNVKAQLTISHAMMARRMNHRPLSADSVFFMCFTPASIVLCIHYSRKFTDLECGCNPWALCTGRLRTGVLCMRLGALACHVLHVTFDAGHMGTQEGMLLYSFCQVFLSHHSHYIRHIRRRTNFSQNRFLLNALGHLANFIKNDPFPYS